MMTIGRDEMKQYAKFNHGIYEVKSVNGGWTTLEGFEGDTHKVRNGMVTEASDDEIERFCKKQRDHLLAEEDIIMEDYDDVIARQKEAKEAKKTAKEAKSTDTVKEMADDIKKIREASVPKFTPNTDKIAEYLSNEEVKGLYTPIATNLVELDAIPKGAIMDDQKNLVEQVADFLRTKYMGLNPGMVRMNLGNRLRAAIKRWEDLNGKSYNLL